MAFKATSLVHALLYSMPVEKYCNLPHHTITHNKTIELSLCYVLYNHKHYRERAADEGLLSNLTCTH